MHMYFLSLIISEILNLRLVCNKNDLGLYCNLVLVMNIGLGDLVIFCLG